MNSNKKIPKRLLFWPVGTIKKLVIRFPKYIESLVTAEVPRTPPRKILLDSPYQQG